MANRRRREIRIGERVVTGVVCDLCPVPVVIYPEETMDKHLARHAATAMAPMEVMAHRSRGGRRPGSRNRLQMSSTGVMHRRNK